jgi:hypothetical protein
MREGYLSPKHEKATKIKVPLIVYYFALSNQSCNSSMLENGRKKSAISIGMKLPVWPMKVTIFLCTQV